jgi:hypothetical protein
MRLEPATKRLKSAAYSPQRFLKSQVLRRARVRFENKKAHEPKFVGFLLFW